MASRSIPDALLDGWAVPWRAFWGSATLLALAVAPVVLVGVVVGPEAAVPMALAYVMCLGVPSRLAPVHAAQLVVIVAVVAAVAVALRGQPFAGACFAVLLCLMMAPVNMLDNGLLIGVPAVVALYLGVPGLELDPAPTALWTLAGGLVAVLLLRTSRRPPLRGVSAATAYRHAAVMAVAMGVSVGLVLELDVPHGYWVPLTLGVVLLPFAAETRSKARQRIVGTVVGGLLALLLAFTLPPAAVLAVMVPLVVLSVTYSVLGRYAQAMAVATPSVVLVANLTSRDAAVQATAERVVATLVGALLAVGLALLLERADDAGETSPRAR